MQEIRRRIFHLATAGSNTQKPLNAALWLAVLYLAGVVLRYILCLVFSQNPFVMPDEALYANLARSIASGSGVMLRNQPVTYTNLLYPLLLSPIYAVASPGSPFRLIQLLNCLLMNLAVFPMWHIAMRFARSEKIALAIAAFSLLIPDMLLTSRIMTEAVEYPLFLVAVLMMFQRLEGRSKIGHAVLAALCAFLLSQAKSGMVALAVVFAAILAFDAVKSRRREDVSYLLAFAGSYAAFSLAAHFAMGMLPGMDFSRQTIYQTQAQAPTLTHLEKTLPGLLLYGFFIPVAFGIFPLLLPACNLRRYESAQRRQLALMLAALAAVAAGACYMFFDTETIGSYYAGRIHIRYVFMFLPVFMAFLSSPKLDGARHNGKLISALGFLLAMAVTVSFGALLSNRRYPVDAISLSWIIWDNPFLNMKLLSQIVAIAFSVAMLWLLIKGGWGRRAKALMACGLALGMLAAGGMGYDMNRYNDNAALAADAKEAAAALEGKPALLVPVSSIYFDNTLSVLDCAMKQAPYEMLLEDLCPRLGPYGELDTVKPPKYWTESPDNEIPAACEVAMEGSAFYHVVPAAGAQVLATANKSYGVITLPENRRLFHSALSGVGYDGGLKAGAALYVFDETLLSRQKVTVYLQVSSDTASSLVLSSGEESYNFDAGPTPNWITCAFTVPQGATRLVVSVGALSGSPKVLTYKVG